MQQDYEFFFLHYTLYQVTTLIEIHCRDFAHVISEPEEMTNCVDVAQCG